MRVLLHDSHADGSGAPGERDWVRDLNDRIVTACRLLGITAVRVPGDLEDHPKFHEDYAAFVSPHYDADIYGEGGAFWDRAALSATAAEDDRLGTIFWRSFRAIPGAPADHFERRNANTGDYFGFRLTTAQTPGVLVEHGVGAPDAPDHQWLRDHIQDIADAWALALNEFGGQGGEMTKDEVDAAIAAYAKKLQDTAITPIQTRLDGVETVINGLRAAFDVVAEQ